MKNIHIVTILLMSLALSSCGLFKKATKIDTSVKVKTSDSTHIAIRKTDSSATSKVTTKEKIDTAVVVPGSSQEGSKDLDAIVKGDSLVLDDEDQRTVVEFDSETQRLRARSKVKDRTEHVQLERETTAETSTDVKRDNSEAVKVAKTDSEADQHKDTKVKTQIGPDWAMWAGLYIAIGLLVLVVVLFYRSKFKLFH